MILRFPFLLMVQSSNGQQRADNLTRRMLHFQHPIRWLKCRSQSLWMVKKHFIIALKVTRASGISKTGRSLLISKVMLSRILKRVGFFHGLHRFSFHFPFHSFDLAWSVSLNPQGETYASTGTSGNISIHSAQPSNFGERLSTLSSGQSKFGMFCAHVCFFFNSSCNLRFFKRIIKKCDDRVQTVDELLCLRKADRFTYLTSKQAPYRSHLPLMPCLCVQSHGLRTRMYVLMFFIF